MIGEMRSGEFDTLFATYQFVGGAGTVKKRGQRFGRSGRPQPREQLDRSGSFGPLG